MKLRNLSEDEYDHLKDADTFGGPMSAAAWGGVTASYGGDDGNAYCTWFGDGTVVAGTEKVTAIIDPTGRVIDNTYKSLPDSQLGHFMAQWSEYEECPDQAFHEFCANLCHNYKVGDVVPASQRALPQH